MGRLTKWGGRRAKDLLSLLLVALIMLLVPRVALAHASLVRADPAPGAVLADGPAYVTIWFAEPVEPRFSSIRVLDSSGRQVDSGDSAVLPSDPKALSVSLRTLASGTYTVAWRNVSALDGHPLQGSYSFAVGEGSVSGPAGEAGVPSWPSPLEPLARWLSLLGALALVGGFSFFLAVAAPALRNYEEIGNKLARRIGVCQWAAAGTLALAEIGRLLVQASTLYDIPVWQAAGIPAARVLADSEWGHVWLWRMALLGVIAVVMVLAASPARGRDRGGFWWLSLAVGAGVLFTFSLNSHGVALPELWAAGVVNDYLHLAAATFWVGGLVHLVLTVPILKDVPDEDRRAILSSLVPQFSRAAALSVGVLIITGLYSAWAMAGTVLAAYNQTAYGISLLVKLALVVPLLVLAAINLLWVRPRLAHPLAAKWLRRVVLGEVVLALLVLVPVGLLTGLEPARLVAAREGLGQPGAQFLHATTTDRHISVVMEPGTVGQNRLLISVTDPRGNPLDNADVNVRLVSSGADIGPTELAAVAQGSGNYLVEEVELDIAGTWRLETTIRSAGAFDVRAAISFDVGNDVPVEALGVTPAMGRALFGVEMVFLGFLFEATASSIGGWKKRTGAAARSLGVATMGVGLVLMLVSLAAVG